MFGVFLLAVGVMASPILAFSRGAGHASCRDLIPGHIRAHSLDLRHSTVGIRSSAHSYLPGQLITVSVRSSRDFMGFLLQARSVTKSSGEVLASGSWVFTPPGTHTLDCFSRGDTVTHSNKQRKRNLSFFWKAPDAAIGDVRFHITVAQSYFVYWAGIESAVVHDGSHRAWRAGNSTLLEETRNVFVLPEEKDTSSQDLGSYRAPKRQPTGTNRPSTTFSSETQIPKSLKTLTNTDFPTLKSLEFSNRATREKYNTTSAFRKMDTDATQTSVTGVKAEITIGLVSPCTAPTTTSVLPNITKDGIASLSPNVFRETTVKKMGTHSGSQINAPWTSVLSSVDEEKDITSVFPKAARSTTVLSEANEKTITGLVSQTNAPEASFLFTTSVFMFDLGGTGASALFPNPTEQNSIASQSPLNSPTKSEPRTEVSVEPYESGTFTSTIQAKLGNPTRPSNPVPNPIVPSMSPTFKVFPTSILSQDEVQSDTNPYGYKFTPEKSNLSQTSLRFSSTAETLTFINSFAPTPKFASQHFDFGSATTSPVAEPMKASLPFLSPTLLSSSQPSNTSQPESFITSPVGVWNTSFQLFSSTYVPTFPPLTDSAPFSTSEGISDPVFLTSTPPELNFDPPTSRTVVHPNPKPHPNLRLNPGRDFKQKIAETKPSKPTETPNKDGKYPELIPRHTSWELGMLLGCSAGLGMVLVVGMRYVYRQACGRRTVVTLNDRERAYERGDRGLIHVRECGDLVRVRKIRENSFVLLAEYDVLASAK